MEVNPIINKVANSTLISLDLDQYINKGERVCFDIKETLYQDIILKEQNFRDFIKEHNWEQYAGKNVSLLCSVDIIIPSWAYMLIATKLSPIANTLCIGEVNQIEKALIDQAIDSIDVTEFKDKKVVIKGCGDLSIRDYAYLKITSKLLPYVSSLMYGEPCSTVPIYKRKS